MGILSAVSNKISQGSFWKLLIGTVVMLVFGYTGEAHLCPGGAWVGFAGGMCGWFFILFEIFAGEAGTVAGELGQADKYTQSSFGTMRLIVTAGWSIYPAGYFFGYLMGGVNEQPQLDLQPCRLRQQDCVLSCNLAGRQEQQPCQVMACFNSCLLDDG